MTLEPRSRAFLVLAIACAGAASCTAAGRTRLAFPAHAAGTGTRTVDARGWLVTLDVTRVALGPIYFCTTRSADIDLCPEALAEVRDAATFDALDAAPQLIGELRGISGTARSAMLDFGITFLLPAVRAMPDPDAVDGAHSMHMEGSAVRGDETVRFVADVDVVSLSSGVRAVTGVPADHTLVDSSDALVVRVDPARWVSRVQFDDVSTMAGDPVVLDASTSGYQALLIGMTANDRPVFEWAREDP